MMCSGGGGKFSFVPRNDLLDASRFKLKGK